MRLEIDPIAYVRSVRKSLDDDDWGNVIAQITLRDDLPVASLDGLDEFSHAEILFLFDQVAPADVERGARHPRGNPAWPKVGIFAQRAKNRPNRLGSTIVEIVARDGSTVTVRGLDAVDGTPVVDIKPVMAEFLPDQRSDSPDGLVN